MLAPGIAPGALYVTAKPVPAMVPKVELPSVTVFTVHVTAVFAVPVTAATSDKVLPRATLAVPVDGMVMATATALEIVTLTDADLDVSAWLVAVILKVDGDGTVAGAVYVTDKPVPLIVPKVELPFVTPLTVHVRAVLLVFDTKAVIGNVAFTSKD